MKNKFKLFGNFSDKYEKVAVGIITIPNTIFVINKKYDAVYFPGGTVEENEDNISALKREIKEELNLDLIKISKKYIETYVYSPKKEANLSVRTYLGIVDGKLKINEEEIEGLIIYPFDLINISFLKWINKKYLLGPSVVDAFIFKKDILNNIKKELL